MLRLTLPMQEVGVQSLVRELRSHMPFGQNPKTSKRSNVGKYVGERELSGTVDGNINWCSHSGEQYGDFSKKTKNRATL